jgi:dTDP-4-dehydrorhamnose reductase
LVINFSINFTIIVYNIMKTILVTGANGLLGQKLVYRLKETEGVTCVATAKGENRLLDQEGYIYYNVDITDHEAMREMIGQVRPDCIIHGAAMTNVDACETDRDNCKKINVDAVENLASICNEFKIHLVHISTDFIFDGQAGPYTEAAIPNPLSYYGWSKLEAEKIVQKMTAPWAILRTVLVYGIVDNMSRSNIVLWVKNSLEQGKEIKVVTDQWRTPTLAEDLAQGCMLAAIKGARGIYNISGDELMNIYEIACKVAQHYGLNESLIHPTDSSTLNQPARRPPKTGFIVEKAKKELGYQPTSFADSLIILDQQIQST